MAHTKDIDLDDLYHYAQIGLSEQQIADMLGIHVSTMTRRKKDDTEFAEVLKAGKAAGVRAVTNALYDGATNPDKPSTSAQIFFLKNRGGWTDRQEVDVSGSVGVDVQLDAAIEALKDAGIDPSKL
jgi:transposase